MATIRQQIAVKKLQEILGKSKGQKNITIGKILKEAGYSKDVCDNPKQVTERKGFKELLDELIPDEKVTAKLNDLMDAKTLDSYRMDAKIDDKEITSIVESVGGCKVRKILRSKSDTHVTVYFWRPDNMIIDKILEKMIKIRGYYAPEKQEHKISGVEIINYGDIKNEKK